MKAGANSFFTVRNNCFVELCADGILTLLFLLFWVWCISKALLSP